MKYKKRFDEEHESVTLFRDYIRLNTAPPYPEMAQAIEFLSDLGAELNCFQEVLNIAHPKAEKGSWLPVLVLSLPGIMPELDSILLYSHVDVVPVYPEKWTYDPFGAEKDSEGNIFGRGTQDMKCISIQYLEALKELKQSGIKLKRTIHLVFGPDEEVNGFGIQGFIKTAKFRSMKVGLALDEAIKVECSGNTGHGSLFIRETAAEKLNKIIDKFLSYRDGEEKNVNAGDKITIEDVVTVNLTRIEGGCEESLNVVPPSMSAYFDIRIPPGCCEKELMKRFQGWATTICRNEGYYDGSIGVEWLNPMPLDDNKTTPLEGNKFWQEFEHVFRKMNLKLRPEIFLAATDTQCLRQINIPVFGFSPLVETPQLLHDHDEYLNENVFLRGIQIYTRILEALGNVS